jgi:C1A family cysteine protease
MDDDDVKDDPADFENQPELDDRDSIVIHDEEEKKEDDKEKDHKEQDEEDEEINPSYISHKGDNFSWLDQMSECIGPIEDQGICGACWAFTSSGFLSDRFCIHSEGQIKTRLSPQEMVNCDFENFGCMGGYLINTIDYL